MRRALAWAALFAALAMGSPAVGQMTLDEARQEGKALGTEKRNDSTLVPSSDAQAAAFDAKTAELVASVAGGGGQTFRTV